MSLPSKTINTLIFLLFLVLQLSATTIVPFPNLGEMAKNTEAIVLVKALNNYEVKFENETRFRTQFQVLETVKGSLQPNDLFDIQHWHLRIGDLERTVWGDLELEEGENYFLFLELNQNGFWQPKMLSYAAFQEVEKNGKKVLLPLGLGAEGHLLKSGNGQIVEPLKTYATRNLIEHLSEVLIGDKPWEKEKVETSYPIEIFNSVSDRNSNPGHCTLSSGATLARWDNFTNTTLPIYHGAAGDPGCSNEVTQIQSAISDMNTQYQGIDISDSGTHSFVPTCSGQGANDAEFTTWIASNMGGDRNLLIQFEDPCNEIADLSGCNGLLAIGGMYWSGATHSSCGMSWYNAAYGFVVVNNGTGACQCSTTDYQTMMTHELSHSLNVGHIAASSGAANMNPNCCTAIQSLDIQCLDYMYPPSILPVELVKFEGRLLENIAQLNWQTGSEISNDYFTIERSTDGISFEKIGQINGSENQSTVQNYRFEDTELSYGLNYYRLSQTDLDGTTEVFEKVITVEYFEKETIKLFPNPLSGSEIRLLYQSTQTGAFQVEIYNVAGKIIKQFDLESFSKEEYFDLNVAELNTGIYYAKIIQQRSSQSLRFLKTE